MAHINHEHLKTFVCVADNQNISKAAEKLNLSQPTVSKHIRALEYWAGSALFLTSPKGATLTEEGAKFLDYAQQVLQLSDSIKRDIKDSRNLLEGDLRIISSRFGIYTLLKHLEKFKEAYPDIKLHIDYDNYVNLIRGIDIPGVYVGLSGRAPLKSTTLIWQKFATYGFYPYANANYVQRFGLPKTWTDLDHHRIAGYQWSEPFTYLEFKESNPLLFIGRDDENPRKPYVILDDIDACRLFIENGHGIGLLPPFLAQGSGFLPLFVGDYNSSFGIINDAYYVIKPGLKTNMRVRTFIDFIKKISTEEANAICNIWGKKENF
ncbi:MAG: LysR family transcriptional regulator [Alphaproteobacteria bacterium]|nr:LysR family transcriptional regulator [Alphaproteobacteria bacterium]OJV46632.1 MAG: hypothetical protein BGO28_04700 [Alphaproteobacteria bacterium 43-37]